MRAGAASSLPACATVLRSGPGVARAAEDPSNIVREAMRNALAGKEAIVPPGPMEWVYSKDAARGTVMALDAQDLGNRVFNITMGSVTTPSEMATAMTAVVPGAKVKFDAPPGTAVALSNRDTGADLSRAERYLGYTPEFKLHVALQDLADLDAAPSGVSRRRSTSLAVQARLRCARFAKRSSVPETGKADSRDKFRSETRAFG